MNQLLTGIIQNKIHMDSNKHTRQNNRIILNDLYKLTTDFSSICVICSVCQ